MRFDEMDKKMRVYEQSLDQVLLPDIYMVAIVMEISERIRTVLPKMPGRSGDNSIE